MTVLEHIRENGLKTLTVLLKLILVTLRRTKTTANSRFGKMRAGRKYNRQQISIQL